jgi:hypothetical protein
MSAVQNTLFTYQQVPHAPIMKYSNAYFPYPSSALHLCNFQTTNASMANERVFADVTDQIG